MSSAAGLMLCSLRLGLCAVLSACETPRSHSKRMQLTGIGVASAVSERARNVLCVSCACKALKLTQGVHTSALVMGCKEHPPRLLGVHHP
eukprot:366301-Chlamydomonas_euryale.AAC.45